MKKKICFLMKNPFTLGGEQRVVSVIANILTNKNFDVTILCTDKFVANYDMYELDRKVEVHQLNITNNLFYKILNNFYKIIRYINKKTNIMKNNDKLLNTIYCNKFLRKSLANTINNSYDYVIGVGGTYTLLVASIKNMINCKVIGWQHSSYDAYFLTKDNCSWHQDILFEKYLNKLDKYIVLTNYDKEKMDKRFDINSIVINNPKSFESDIVSNLGNKKFIAMGRFVYVKAFEDLIEAFNLFSKKNNDWNLYIYGDGPYKDKYIELIEQYNLENRIFIENYTDDVKKVLLDSSIYLLSSRWEGFPMVVLEAMEMGLPVISYDISASKEIIINNSGILVRSRNIEEYADAMLNLANNPDLLKEMGKCAKINSENYSYEKIGNQWFELLDSSKE